MSWDHDRQNISIHQLEKDLILDDEASSCEKFLI